MTCNLREYIENFGSELNFEQRLELCYKIVYAVNSLLIEGIPPPIIDPSHIFISKNGNPQILFPFFSNYGFSYKNYFIEMLKRNEEPIFDFSFIPPFYLDLNDKSDLLVYLKCK